MLLRALLAAAVALLPPGAAARITTGQNPCGAAAGFGGLWVANYGSGTLVRVDPRTNRVSRRVVVGPGACAVVAAGRAVWVTNDKRGAVLRVDPRTRVVRAVAVGGQPFNILFASGSLWTTTWDGGALVEIDPATARVVRRISVGGHPAGLAWAAGAVWVGFGRGAQAIARVDPSTGKVERVEVGGTNPTNFARGTGDALWVNVNDGDVVRVDARTRKVVATLHVGYTLANGAAAPDGTIWLPDKQVDRVYRIDPAGNRVRDSFAAGDGAFVVTRAFGSMWVTSYVGSDVWRFKG